MWWYKALTMLPAGREENNEAMVHMEFHDTSSSAVNEEVLIVGRRNDGDDCAVSQDTDRNIKQVPYDIQEMQSMLKS